MDRALMVMGIEADDGIRRAAAMDAAYQMKKAEGLVKEFPPYFYVPDAKLLKHQLLHAASTFGSTDSLPKELSALFVQLLRFFACRHMEFPADFTEQAAIKKLVTSLTKEQRAVAMTEAKTAAANYKGSGYSVFIDPVYMDDLFHPFQASDMAVLTPVMASLKTLANAAFVDTTQVDVMTCTGVAAKVQLKPTVQFISTFDLLLNTRGYSESFNWYKNNGYQLIEDRLQLYLHPCKVVDAVLGPHTQYNKTTAEAKAKGEQDVLLKSNLPTMFFIDYDEDRLAQYRALKGKTTSSTKYTSKVTMDRIVMLIPEQVKGNVGDLKAAYTNILEYNQDMQQTYDDNIGQGDDTISKERRGKALNALSALKKTFSEVSIPSHKVKYLQCVRGIYIVTFAATDTCNVVLDYTVKSRPIYHRKLDSIYSQFLRPFKRGVHTFYPKGLESAKSQTAYDFNWILKHGKRLEQMAMDPDAAALTYHGLAGAGPGSTSLAKPVSFNMLDTTVQLYESLMAKKQFLKVVYDNPFGVACMKLTQAQQLTLSNFHMLHHMKYSGLAGNHYCFGVPQCSTDVINPNFSQICGLYTEQCHAYAFYNGGLSFFNKMAKGIGGGEVTDLMIQAFEYIAGGVYDGVSPRHGACESEYIRKLGITGQLEPAVEALHNIPDDLKTEESLVNGKTIWKPINAKMRVALKMEQEAWDKVFMELRNGFKQYKFNPFVVDQFIGTMLSFNPMFSQLEFVEKHSDRPKSYYMSMARDTFASITRTLTTAKNAGWTEIETFSNFLQHDDPNAVISAAPGYTGIPTTPTRAMAFTARNYSTWMQMNMGLPPGEAFQEVQNAAQQKIEYNRAKYTGTVNRKGKMIQAAITTGVCLGRERYQAAMSQLVPVTVLDVIALCHQSRPQVAIKHWKIVILTVYNLFLKLLIAYVTGPKRKSSLYDQHYVLSMIEAWLQSAFLHLLAQANGAGVTGAAEFADMAEALRVFDPDRTPLTPAYPRPNDEEREKIEDIREKSRALRKSIAMGMVQSGRDVTDEQIRQLVEEQNRQAVAAGVAVAKRPAQRADLEELKEGVGFNQMIVDQQAALNQSMWGPGLNQSRINPTYLSYANDQRETRAQKRNKKQLQDQEMRASQGVPMQPPSSRGGGPAIGRSAI